MVRNFDDAVKVIYSAYPTQIKTAVGSWSNFAQVVAGAAQDLQRNSDSVVATPNAHYSAAYSEQLGTPVQWLRDMSSRAGKVSEALDSVQTVGVTAQTNASNAIGTRETTYTTLGDTTATSSVTAAEHRSVLKQQADQVAATHINNQIDTWGKANSEFALPGITSGPGNGPGTGPGAGPGTGPGAGHGTGSTSSGGSDLRLVSGLGLGGVSIAGGGRLGHHNGEPPNEHLGPGGQPGSQGGSGYPNGGQGRPAGNDDGLGLQHPATGRSDGGQGITPSSGDSDLRVGKDGGEFNGWFKDPRTGFYVDPGTGREYDPSTQRWVDPVTGKPFGDATPYAARLEGLDGGGTSGGLLSSAGGASTASSGYAASDPLLLTGTTGSSAANGMARAGNSLALNGGALFGGSLPPSLARSNPASSELALKAGNNMSAKGYAARVMLDREDALASGRRPYLPPMQGGMGAAGGGGAAGRGGRSSLAKSAATRRPYLPPTQAGAGGDQRRGGKRRPGWLQDDDDWSVLGDVVPAVLGEDR